MSRAAEALPAPPEAARARLLAAYKRLRLGTEGLTRAPNGELLFGVSPAAVRAYVLARFWGRDVRDAIAAAVLGVAGAGELGAGGRAWVDGIAGVLARLEGRA